MAPYDHANIGTNNISYYGAHQRVYRKYGPASKYPCVDCNKPAKQWSYDGKDIDNELAQIRSSRDRTPIKYSPDPDHYQARCTTCHTKHDTKQRYCDSTDCNNKHYALGLCSYHYGKQLRAKNKLKKNDTIIQEQESS